MRASPFIAELYAYYQMLCALLYGCIHILEQYIPLIEEQY